MLLELCPLKKESAKLRGLRGNVDYVGQFFTWVKIFFTWVIVFTWVAWVYIFAWVRKSFAWVFAWVNF